MKGKVLLRLGVLFAVCAVWSCAFAAQGSESYVFVGNWGREGSGDGEFRFPQGVAVDSSGNVYVADRNNDRMQKFTPGGVLLKKWGTNGEGEGEFEWPSGVAVDTSGNVYVADTSNHRIQKFTSEGVFLTEWGNWGSGDGKFNEPRGVAVDGSGNVYVLDYVNQRIQKFTSQGAFLKKWGRPGSGDGEFHYPGGIAVDPVPGGGNVYVAEDGDNHRIQKFTSEGAFLTKWGSWGEEDGQFEFPCGLAVDSSGNVYVTDPGNHRIQKFTSEGVFLKKWGTAGSGDGAFDSPLGVAVDTSGNVYVVEMGNNRIQKFRPILFRVERARYAPAGLTVVWVSVPGERYQIWQSGDLSAWSSLPTIIESEGEFTSWTDDTASEVPKRFYRVELLP